MRLTKRAVIGRGPFPRGQRRCRRGDVGRSRHEDVQRRADVRVLGLPVQAALGRNAGMGGQEQGAFGKLAHHILAGEEFHHLGDLFGVLGVFDRDQSRAAGQAGTGGGAAGRSGRDPVEPVADLGRQVGDLPGPGIVVGDLRVDEIIRRCAIGRPRRRDPGVLQHLAVCHPADQLGCEFLDARVNRRRAAVGGDIVAAIGRVRPRDAVAGPVDGKGRRRPL